MNRIHNTAELVLDLSEATDYELALAYYWSEEEDSKYPFWIVDAERRRRDLELTDLEGLLLSDF